MATVADPATWSTLDGLQATARGLARDRAVHREIAAAARARFRGPVTYAAGLWEDVEWDLFNIVSVDAYRDARNAAGCCDQLRDSHRHGKPVAVTEFGCCSYRGAAARGGGGWMIIDETASPRALDGDYKDMPAQEARRFKTAPWTVTVDGECNNKAAYHVEDIVKAQQLEERVYRHRCVEAWSMVIPWVGFPLGNFIKRCDPTSKAKFIEFYDALRSCADAWAARPGAALALCRGTAHGRGDAPAGAARRRTYGEVLPNQDGAPIRLVVPWKYGFKSIKSIVRIRFVEKQPANSWQLQASNEYGFYANVNPTVDHPRWSQASERRIGEFFKRKTLMFNGYGDAVASMYAGMDLKRNF